MGALNAQLLRFGRVFKTGKSGRFARTSPHGNREAEHHADRIWISPNFHEKTISVGGRCSLGSRRKIDRERRDRG